MQPSLDGRRFRVSEMEEHEEASAETVFEYHEDGDVVCARYQGGSVRLGFLVGSRNRDRLDLRYSRLNENGQSSSGRCSTTITRLPDGRLRLAEDGAWESKPGSGTSVGEEAR